MYGGRLGWHEVQLWHLRGFTNDHDRFHRPPTPKETVLSTLSLPPLLTVTLSAKYCRRALELEAEVKDLTQECALRQVSTACALDAHAESTGSEYLQKQDPT